MKKLVLIVSMFSILAASTSSLACGNTSADKNARTAAAGIKTRTTVSSILGGSV